MQKIYPNDPCPCGSGLKFKKCKCEKYHPRKTVELDAAAEGLKTLGLEKAEENVFVQVAECVKELYQKEKDLYGSSLRQVTPMIIKEDRPVAVSRQEESGSRVIISSGLIDRYLSLVEERFPDSITEKFFKQYSGAEVRRRIFETILEETVLHEYYHWFRGHGAWGADHNPPPAAGKASAEEQFLFNFRQQGLQYDADRYAVNMLVKMLSEKDLTGEKALPEKEMPAEGQVLTEGRKEQKLTEEDVLCALLAFSTITARADHDQTSGKGYDFTNYAGRLIQANPLPALRFYYLQKCFLKGLEKAEIFTGFAQVQKEAVSAAYEIEKAVAAADGREFVFMDTAHTERALEWQSEVVSNLRKRTKEMAGYSEVNYLGEPEAWESDCPKEDIWFLEDGTPG